MAKVQFQRKTSARKIKPLVLITPGDPDGVGPEITQRVLSKELSRTPRCSFLIVGARRPFLKSSLPFLFLNSPKEAKEQIQKNTKSKLPLYFLCAPSRSPRGLFLPGYQSGWSVQLGAEWVRDGFGDALVTGPIHKERLQRGGFAFDGHTELLAKVAGGAKPVMMLANDDLRVSLVTTHTGIKTVSKKITLSSVSDTIRITATALQDWYGISKPKIAVLSLNPHGGEAGLFGNEEILVIKPAMMLAKQLLNGRVLLDGPFPSDSFFALNHQKKKHQRYDAVVCMYHDQALIPVKLLDFQRTVNLTLGLPFLRTSVDHGVAFDIVGKNKADPSSLESAIDLALEIIRKKKTYEKKLSI